MRPVAWLRANDPGFAALRCAGRTAIVMPLVRSAATSRTATARGR